MQAETDTLHSKLAHKSEETCQQKELHAETVAALALALEVSATETYILCAYHIFYTAMSNGCVCTSIYEQYQQQTLILLNAQCMIVATFFVCDCANT
jgi:hypothetical protein